MPRIIASALAMIFLAAATYATLNFGFDAPAELSSGVAGFFILCMGPLRDYLEESNIKRIARRKNLVSIPDMNALMLKPYVGVLIGSLMVFSSIQVSSGLAGVSISVIEENSNVGGLFSAEALGSIALPLQYVFIFFIARWLSANLKRFLLPMIFAAVVSGRLAGGIFDVIVGTFIEIPEEMIVASLSEVLVISGFYALITAPSWLLGWFLGKRRRETVYLAFLISGLKPQQRKVLADIALEEVVSLRSKALDKQ